MDENSDVNLTDVFAKAKERRAAEMEEENKEMRRKDRKMAYISIGLNIFAAIFTDYIAYPNFFWMMFITLAYGLGTYFGPISYLKYLRQRAQESPTETLNKAEKESNSQN